MRTENVRVFLAKARLRAMQENKLKQPITISKAPPLVPSGCKEYYFSIKGIPSSKLEDKTGAIYSCISSNEKNAIRKFKKWINTPSLQSVEV